MCTQFPAYDMAFINELLETIKKEGCTKIKIKPIVYKKGSITPYNEYALKFCVLTPDRQKFHFHETVWIRYELKEGLTEAEVAYEAESELITAGEGYEDELKLKLPHITITQDALRYKENVYYKLTKRLRK